MFLFELAMELGERSADMADAAPGLGIEGVTPTSELTAEQVEAFRARFTKAAVASGPTGSPYLPAHGAPAHPVAPLLPPPVDPGGGSGIGIGQIVLIALAVVGVIGLFTFMFRTGKSDQERREIAAAADPVASDGEIPTTGPDGKPLTDEQRFNLAKLEAAKAANEERTCQALRSIHDADIAAGQKAATITTPADMAAHMVQVSEQTAPLYDPVIAALPEQADGLRKLQQLTRDTGESFRGVTDAAGLRQRMDQLEAATRSSGALEAALALDGYAKTTCGFPTSTN